MANYRAANTLIEDGPLPDEKIAGISMRFAYVLGGRRVHVARVSDDPLRAPHASAGTLCGIPEWGEWHRDKRRKRVSPIVGDRPYGWLCPDCEIRVRQLRKVLA